METKQRKKKTSGKEKRKRKPIPEVPMFGVVPGTPEAEKMEKWLKRHGFKR